MKFATWSSIEARAAHNAAKTTTEDRDPRNYKRCGCLQETWMIPMNRYATSVNVTTINKPTGNWELAQEDAIQSTQCHVTRGSVRSPKAGNGAD